MMCRKEIYTRRIAYKFFYHLRNSKTESSVRPENIGLIISFEPKTESLRWIWWAPLKQQPSEPSNSASFSIPKLNCFIRHLELKSTHKRQHLPNPDPLCCKWSRLWSFSSSPKWCPLVVKYRPFCIGRWWVIPGAACTVFQQESQKYFRQRTSGQKLGAP